MRKNITKTAAFILGAATMCVFGSFNVFAGTWREEGWKYYDESGRALKGWIEDAGKHYYLDKETGSMKTSWLKDGDGKWYFLNTSTENGLGARLTGWQWIDGYCYSFTDKGIMEQSVKTSDGYIVNELGRWTDEKGAEKYEEGKGLSSNGRITMVGENGESKTEGRVSASTESREATVNTGKSEGNVEKKSTPVKNRVSGKSRAGSGSGSGGGSSSGSSGGGSKGASGATGGNSGSGQSSGSSGGSDNSGSSGSNSGSGSGTSGSSGSGGKSGESGSTDATSGATS